MFALRLPDNLTKKKTSPLLPTLQKSGVDVGAAKMSLADRMKILKDKEEQWKDKGKGAANDSVQFTVAGRMAKRGTAAARSFEQMVSANSLQIAITSTSISVLCQCNEAHF